MNQGLRVPRAVLLIPAVAAAELVLGVAIAQGQLGLEATVAGCLLSAAILACILAPRAVLLLVAACWGAVHTILTDFTVASVGSIHLNLSRELGVILLVGFAGRLVVDMRGRRVELPLALKALLLFLL